MKHERRVIGHASGRQELMNTCVCGHPWPCTQSTEVGNQSETAFIDLTQDEKWLLLEGLRMVKRERIERATKQSIPAAQLRDVFTLLDSLAVKLGEADL